MLLTIRTTHRPATDLGFLLHKHPEQVLDAIDKVLIPNAANAELKALLVKVRPAFVAHLQHAKHLQKSTSEGR